MQKFATPTPITAVLDIPAGRLQLIAADRTDTTVEIQPTNPAKNRDVQAAEQTTVTYTDGVLRIHTPTHQPALRPLRIPRRSPSSCPPAPTSRPPPPPANSAASAAWATSPSTAPTARSKSTRPRASASPRSTATSRSAAWAAPHEISTTRGDIRITEAAGGTVVLSTQSGDISIAAAAGVSAALDAGTSSAGSATP